MLFNLMMKGGSCMLLKSIHQREKKTTFWKLALFVKLCWLQCYSNESLFNIWVELVVECCNVTFPRESCTSSVVVNPQGIGCGGWGGVDTH